VGSSDYYGGGNGGKYTDNCYNNPWGYGYYNGRLSFNLGFNWYWGDCWWYWPSYFSCYYPVWYGSSGYGYGYGYGNYYPHSYYSTVIYRTIYEDVGETVAVVEEPEAQGDGNGLFPSPLDQGLSIAAERYLTLGDRAFREGRWSDAVQLYAKAVELAPKNAGLYLVLSDSLFAAGDYHYAAFAIRKAVELDPVLLSVPIDKHGFYSNPADFDAQLARLELYLIEHASDRDARLVLAVNFLFGNRPAAAVDLYEAGAAPAAALAQGDAVRVTLESARAAQFGEVK
jgi:tetratricopeptide (TPR) repeat protein